MADLIANTLRPIFWDSLDPARIPARVNNAFRVSKASGLLWTDSAHNNSKLLLRTYLFDKQQSKCAYCRRDIKDEPGHVEIDHILPKKPNGSSKNWTQNSDRLRRSTEGYAQFEFVPKNLVLTCKNCNNKKGTYDCRSDRSKPSRRTYSRPAELCWVHPYLHIYSEHIELIRGFIFRPHARSAEGEAVISVCKLDKLAAIEVKAREKHVRRVKNAKRALLELAPHLDDYTDDGLVAIFMANYPTENEDDVRFAIQGLRVTSIEQLAGIGRREAKK